MAKKPKPAPFVSTQGKEFDTEIKVTGVGKQFEEVKLTMEQQKAWEMTRAALLWNCPAFTHILYSMMNPTGSSSVAFFTKDIPTLATNGVNLVVNPDYFFSKPLLERIFMIAHEIMHNVWDHCGQMHAFQKRGVVPLASGKKLPYEPMFFNVATDLVINDCLIQSNVGKYNSDWLHDPKVATAKDSAIDAYEKVYKMKPGGGGGGGQHGMGNQKGFDQHLAPDQGNKPGQQQGQQRNAMEWKTAVAAAAASAKAQGKLPQALEQFFGEMLNPQVPWQEKIQAFFNRKVGSGSYNWRRPDRRLIVRDIYAPGRSGFGAGCVVVGFDTSGSIYGDPGLIDRFLAEVGGILADVKPKRLVVVWCDAAVHRTDEIDELTDLKGLKPVGGGGTAFGPVFDWIESQQLEPDALVYLTDGYGSFPSAEPRYPVLWGNISPAGSVSYPWGEIVDIPQGK